MTKRIKWARRKRKKLRGVKGNSAEGERAESSATETPQAATSDLWSEVGRDFDQGISETATKFQISKERLLALLIAECFNESGTPLFSDSIQRGAVSSLGRFKGLVIRHWPDLLLLGVLPLIVTGLAIRGVRLARQKSAPQVVVHLSGGVPAFHLIKSNEVTLEERPKELQAVTSLDRAVGHYSLVNIAPGSVLHENQIVSDEQTIHELEGRSIIRIPTKAAAFNEEVTSVAHVRLMFSGGQSSREDTRLVEDVILLGIYKQGESNVLVLAVTKDQIESMRGILGRLDVFVLQ
jgi:hypothetical protein